MAPAKKTLLTMIFVFVAPIVIGSVMFMNAERLGMDTSTVNYGQLVQPPVNISTDGVILDGQPADPENLARNQWTLLYLNQAECGDACRARLDLLKRIRLLTNEDMRRIRTVSVGDTPWKDTDALKNAYPDLMLAELGDAPDNFLKQFPKQDEHPIYLIDPLGNLMMYYVGEVPDIKGIMKDFKRILKYSQIG
jgi:cytochrome oxidase Cu insertion factor (SCO1/SenC/PrrC family)